MKSHMQTLSTWLGLVCLLPAASSFAVPANDNFDSPAVIAGFPLTATGSNVEATVESGEALPAGYDFYAVKSVWFSWTAPTSGIVQIDTYGSHEDSEYWDSDNPLFRPNPSVWLGDTLETLVEVQSGGARQSRYLNAVSGTTYRIAVYGLGNDNYDEGQIVLNITNDATAGISGTLTDTNGAPLAGIMARALEPDDYSYDRGAAWAFTDAAGNYSIRGLSAGDYRVLFSGMGFAAEFFDDVPDRYDPYSTDMDATTLLSITNGETIGDIDATLAASASVSGTVTGPGGLPLSGITIWIEFSVDWYNDEAITDENGDYLVENLPPDPYTVRFTDFAGDYLGTSTNVVLDAGTHLADVDVTLDVASKISGTVLADADSSPLEGINVAAYQWTGLEWDRMRSADSDANGDFTIGGLVAGTYRVQFEDWNGNYLDEVYDNVASLDSGTDVVVGPEATVSNINASLATAASISGTITDTNSNPLDYFRAEAYQWNGAAWVAIRNGFSDSEGAYAIRGLAAGTYRIWFSDGDNNYLAEAYDDAASLDAGTDVVVGAGGSETGIDAALSLRPPDPPALFQLRSVTSNSVEIRYGGTIGEDYIAQQSFSLSDGWTDVGDPVYCDSDTNTVILPLTTNKFFLRIRRFP